MWSFSDTFRLSNGNPAPVYGLTTNYRCAQTILAAAEQIMAAAEPSSASSVDLYRQVTPPGTPAGTVEARGFLTAKEETEWVADRIVEAHVHNGHNWGEIGCLFRRNSDIPRLYEALVDRDVPCEIIGLGGLLHLPDIAEIIAAATVATTDDCNAEIIRILTGSRWRIGPADLAQLGRRAKELATQPHQAADLIGDPVCLIQAVVDPGEG
jgi:DNA helicase-2/ATP-dependent DNA helicase PcrA